MKTFKIVLLLSVIAAAAFGCTDKFDIANNPRLKTTGGGNIGDTVYIKQNPDWGGFNNPQDMTVGKDGFIYVCDTDNDRILMMNQAGHVLSATPSAGLIKRPIAIDQDYLLNLIVCAEFDSLGQRYSAVYKIDLHSSGHQLESAPVKRILPLSTIDFSRPERKFTAVCAFYDNSYYIARQGPKNDLIDPDNAILIFKQDLIQDYRVSPLSPLGTGLLSSNGIVSMKASGKKNYDFLLALSGGNFKLQYLKYFAGQDFTGYKATGTYSLKSGRQPLSPAGACLDKSGNLFLADALSDSVYKFNSYGDQLQAFGGIGIFASPKAVAFSDKTLFVLDSKNGTILRFILSTDIY